MEIRNLDEVCDKKRSEIRKLQSDYKPAEREQLTEISRELALEYDRFVMDTFHKINIDPDVVINQQKEIQKLNEHIKVAYAEGYRDGYRAGVVKGE